MPGTKAGAAKRKANAIERGRRIEAKFASDALASFNRIMASIGPCRMKLRLERMEQALTNQPPR